MTGNPIVVTTKGENAYRNVRMPATWPAPPRDMSVSTYAEIDECPRRWALGAAEYPDVWSGRGYPPRLQLPALAGSVVHMALEIVAKQLSRAGVPSVDDPLAAQVLKELGGYTRVVERCVDRILQRFTDNPRAFPLMERASRTLRGQVPTLRARVQSILTRLRLPEGAPRSPSVLARDMVELPKRGPLSNGTYAELELHAKSIGWKGKADLLVLADHVCEITDFKTGTAQEEHKVQVRVYAVLWQLDEELNPSSRAVDRLVLAYENHDTAVPPPSAQEVGELSRELSARRKAAEASLAERPPSARPGAETCRYCGVRHLCDVYWAGATQSISDDGRFGDVEVQVVGRHGPTSWDALVVRARDVTAKSPALLRLQEHLEFTSGAKLRVLDGAFSRDPEDANAPLIITVGAVSEIYRVG